MRVYISGPMTGKPDYNRAAFEVAEAYVKHRGDEAVNPFDIQCAGKDWASYMREDIRALTTCEGIVVLPGWEGSRGACLEVHIARELGLAFTFLPY
jgi:hypothetical protein